MTSRLSDLLARYPLWNEETERVQLGSISEDLVPITGPVPFSTGSSRRNRRIVVKEMEKYILDDFCLGVPTKAESADWNIRNISVPSCVHRQHRWRFNLSRLTKRSIHFSRHPTGNRSSA